MHQPPLDRDCCNTENTRYGARKIPQIGETYYSHKGDRYNEERVRLFQCSDCHRIWVETWETYRRFGVEPRITQLLSFCES